jgi:hypothetical protein
VKGLQKIQQFLNELPAKSRIKVAYLKDSKKDLEALLYLKTDKDGKPVG